MATSDTRDMVKARRSKPSISSAGSEVAKRGTLYGEPVHQSLLGGKLYALADEGSYFVSTNPTPGTGVAGHAAPTTLDATKPTFLVKNTASSSTNTCIYMDYLSMWCTAAGTNATDLRWAIYIDDIERYASAGTAMTFKNVNMNSSDTASITGYHGAPVAVAAGSNARLVAHGLVRTVIPVVADHYRWCFGSDSQTHHSNLSTVGTAIAQIVIPCPPVVIGPGQSMLFHTFSGSQSGAHSFEWNMGLWQR